MIRIESSWSGLPQDPNIIAPRQSGETLTPVRPRVRSSMPPRLAATTGQPGGGDGGGAPQQAGALLERRARVVPGEDGVGAAEPGAQRRGSGGAAARPRGPPGPEVR